MELNSLFHCEQTTKKSVSYFALDGGATELYIMSKSRVNDILISTKKKLFVLCFECREKKKKEKKKTPLEEGKFGFLVFFIR